MKRAYLLNQHLQGMAKLLSATYISTKTIQILQAIAVTMHNQTKL